MPTGVSNGYQGGNSVGVVNDGYSRYIKVYNDSGAAVSEGAVVEISFADSGTAGKYPCIATPIETATSTVLIGVVSNFLNNASTIPDDSWGWVQVRGYCDKLNTAGSVTIEHHLEVTAAAPTVATTEASATTWTTSTFAVAKSAVTGAGEISAFLFGKPVVIAAS